MSSVDFMLHENIEPCVGTGSVTPSDVVIGVIIEEAKIVAPVVVRVVV